MESIKESVINKIENLVNNIPGWCPSDQLFAMYLLAINSKDLEGDLLEIGSWCGKSAVVLALAAEKIGATLQCVDLFPNKEDWFENEDRTYSFSTEINGRTIFANKNVTVWKEPFENSILPVYDKYGDNLQRIFRNNIDNSGFKNIVLEHKADSTEFIRMFPDKKIKFAFIDSDHSYEGACTDIENVERLLVPGGWMVFDDAFSSYEVVDKAIQEKIIDSKKYDIKQQLTRKCFAARKKI